jgi:hypothetical protein
VLALCSAFGFVAMFFFTSTTILRGSYTYTGGAIYIIGTIAVIVLQSFYGLKAIQAHRTGVIVEDLKVIFLHYFDLT